MKLDMSLSKNLKRYLDLRGWSVAEVARRSGVKKSTIGEWLSGRNPRKLADLKKVALVLDVEGGIDELIFGEPPNGSKKKKEADLIATLFDSDGHEFRGRFELVIRKLKD